MSTNETTTFQISETLLKKCIRRHIVRSISKRRLFAWVGSALYLLIIILSLILGHTTNALVLLELVLLAVLMVAIGQYMAVRQHRRSAKKMSDDAVTFVCRDDHLVVETALTSATLTWNMIEEVAQYPDVWLLYISRTQFLMLPTDAASETLMSFIEQKVASAGGVDYFKCQSCQYDLAGNTAGQCPECGEPIAFEKLGISKERFQAMSQRLLQRRLQEQQPQECEQ